MPPEADVEAALPVLRTRFPLTPLVVTEVAKEITPLLVRVPDPLEMVTSPPVLGYDVPAAIVMLPPLPDCPTPTVMEIPPPAPLLAKPVPM